uniref:C2H2-type domain-containing protein n=1 Tax=Panagrellus redivivus TaxID=6233 RepID=A0A7E4VZH6_PANRE
MSMTASFRNDEDVSDDESTATVDLSMPKKTASPVPKPPPQTFPLPPSFPMPPPFNLFPRMPMFMPPFNPAVIAMYSKQLQAQKMMSPHRARFPPSASIAIPSAPPKMKSSSSAPKTTAPNPIVNAVLSQAPIPGSETNGVINQNVCAVCGEAFRLTGDLVHHMRRERCRRPTSSELSAPYRIPKHHAK